jgi:hypothetical protein
VGWKSECVSRRGGSELDLLRPEKASCLHAHEGRAAQESRAGSCSLLLLLLLLSPLFAVPHVVERVCVFEHSDDRHVRAASLIYRGILIPRHEAAKELCVCVIV